MCSGCDGAAAVSAGTNTSDVCVPRWRELSRNKSRDEREMWPNRTAHTDTVSRGRGKKEPGDALAAGAPFPLRSALISAVRPARKFSSNIAENESIVR